jgi:mRNA-degrading endonuclease RelE of RelBE toxin-antitoxin system
MVEKRKKKSCQKEVKKLSKSCQKSCQKVVKKLSKKLSKSCQIYQKVWCKKNKILKRVGEEGEEGEGDL